MSAPNPPDAILSNADLKNPFVGPRSIEEGQKIFGRDREIQALYYKLSADRIVLLYSPSGAGKTSMIQAGLIPRLRENFEVWGPIRVNQEPQNAPAGANRYSLSCKLRIDPAAPLNDLGPSVSLGEFVSSRRAKLKSQRLEELKKRGDEDEDDEADDNIVLVFDQFEEVLTTDPLDLGTKKAFFKELGSLLQGDRHLWALFMIREDYLAQLDPYCDDLPTHLNSRFRIDLLACTEAQKAIESLAALGKPSRSFSEEAISRLINDLSAVKLQLPNGKIISAQGNSIEPLHLQVVCRNLWERLKPRRMTIERRDVAKFGDVTEALAGYYAATMAEIAHGDKRTQRRIREWVGRLITPADTRGQVQLGEGKTGGLDNETEVALLVRSHLIRPEPRAGSTWYELSHDRLIPPVKEDNRRWLEANLSPLQKQAALWSQQGEPDGLLFSGKQLKAAEAEAAKLELAPTETKFIQVAKLARTRSRTVRGIVAVFTLLIWISFGLLMWQYVKVRRAEQKADTALVQSLVNSGKGKLSTNSEVDDLASMVAVLEAEHKLRELKDATPDLRAVVRGALQKVVYGIQERNRFQIAGNVLVARFNLDGSRIAAIDDAGAAYRWERSGKKLDEFQGPVKPGGVADAAFSEDLNTLVTVHVDPSDPDESSIVLVWDLNLQQQMASLEAKDGVVSKVAIDPEGKRIATVGQGGLHLWDAQGAELKQWGRFPEPSSAVAFSADGKQLAWYSNAGVRILDLAGGHPVRVLVRGNIPDHDPDADAILEFVPKKNSLMISGALYDLDTGRSPGVNTGATSFSPDSLWFAKSSDGIPEIFQSSNNQNVAWLAGHKGDEFEAFGPGRLALTAGQDHSIRLWDLIPRFAAEFDNSLGVASSISPRVYVSNFDNVFKLWSQDGHPLGELQWHLGPPANENALSPDATRLVVCKEGKCRIWETKTGLFREIAISHPLLGLATLSGKLALVTASKSDVEIKDEVGATLSKFSLPAGTSSTILNQDRTLLISSSISGVSLWNLSGQRMGGFNTKLPEWSRLQEGSDRQRIAISIHETVPKPKSTIFVYDQDGKLVASFEDGFRAALGPDGKLIAIADRIYNVPTIWDVETQKAVAQYAGNGDFQFTFTPDGKFVLMAGTDEPARLWRVETTEELVTEACQWIGGYLRNNPDVSPDDRQLCPQ
jgi:WD40 repeat protein